MKQARPPVEIEVSGRVPRGFSRIKIRNMLMKIAKQEKLTLSGVGVAFVGEEQIRNFNKKYRRMDKPTDILSFAYHNQKTPKKNIQGDLIICPAYIKKDIKNSAITITNQIKRLFVHGLLHLAGYDHAKEKEAKHMFQKQEKLLKTI